MLLRFAVAAFAALMLTRCGSETHATLSPDQLEAAIQATQTPLVVLLWGDWSRPAVELLPTAAELAWEYQGERLIFYTVSLGQPPHKDARGMLDDFPSGTRHFTLEDDPAKILSRFGLADVPAALFYAPGAKLRMTLDSPEAADLADAIESLLRPSEP